MNDSYAFSNAIRFISFNSILDHRKIGKILPTCILFLRNMIPNRAIRQISYDNRQILLESNNREGRYYLSYFI